VTGEIVRRAKLRGVATPLNAAALRMLKEIEARARTIDRTNLDTLAGLVRGA
jgi:ketopantoate reductase